MRRMSVAGYFEMVSMDVFWTYEHIRDPVPKPRMG